MFNNFGNLLRVAGNLFFFLCVCVPRGTFFFLFAFFFCFFVFLKKKQYVTLGRKIMSQEGGLQK